MDNNPGRLLARSSRKSNSLPHGLFLHKLTQVDRIDFRSDTVTWPTPSMRRAMAKASLGDDVYGEDPTVNQLEALAAEKTGTEAGLFVSSGTMGNIAAILSHANRGDEAILGIDSHVMTSEGGGMSVLGGIMPKPVATDRKGMISRVELASAISPDDPHFPRTKLIVVENTYGSKNGYPLPPQYFEQVASVAKENGLSVHMDGARLFNAAVAQSVDVKEITGHIDSVSFCLSKGLCAPVGSVLCGSKPFIDKARRMRKVLGGGMRQAGILAAAGIVALEEMVDRLAIDHANAQTLADGLSEIPGIELERELIKTNIVFFDLDPRLIVDADHLVKTLRDRYGIWLGVDGATRIRAVTHYWVGDAEVNLLLNKLRELVQF